MVHIVFCFIVMACFCCGCRHQALRGNTMRMASTINDLQYQPILNNLAMLSTDLELLPWHIKLDDGTVQIEDEGRLGLDLSPYAANWAPLAGGFGERRQTQRWGVVPVTDPKELRDLHAVYRRALGLPVEDNESDGDDEEPNGEKGGEAKESNAVPEGIEEVPTAWFATGYRHEVPRDAALVGQWRDRYAWVLDGKTRDLLRSPSRC